MSDIIKELPILSSTGEVLFGLDSYIIPLYQRAFAWEDKQITQLISDIEDIGNGGSRYYLGNLIVHRRKDDGKFEVIDGQQRLTALFLILSKLDFSIHNNALTYQHRDKSIKALAAAQAQKAGISKSIDWEDANERIRQTFQKEIKITMPEEFIEKLKRVLIIRIEVPEHTDLNKYFEIMNSRGEQLELSDILKAKLMATLSSDGERVGFSRIWAACSNMNGYMQMHLKKQEREHYFDWNWMGLPKADAEFFVQTDNNIDAINAASIDDIINNDKFKGRRIIDFEEADDTLRFDSFLSFNYFLLHTLRVFMGKVDDGGLLDDKKLLKDFDVAIGEKKAVGTSEKDFALAFIRCLMRCRFLFDNYIIKRERLKDDLSATENDGREWSLKKLVTYQGNDKRYGKSYLKPNYINTADTSDLEMLQSMLRVTYTSLKVMHWVTKHLAFLYSKDNIDIAEAEKDLEAFARKEVHKNYLSGGNFEIELDIHHIVLNYIDYLLWTKDKSATFKFEFRNSVEHWYPQNPIDGNLPWDKAPLNCLGNLCLVSSSLNSKFSNNLPMAKKNNFGTSLVKQSLKLREMASKTNENDDWTADKAQAHGDEMIAMLKAKMEKETNEPTY